MLIGIDMLGVQSREGGNRDTGRFGRQFVASLLANDPVNRYILYAHEGFPTQQIPHERNALRVSLAPIPGGSNRLRPTIQRVIDQNPDDLDWLILLDPFESNYGAMPPESPLNELKIASLLLDLAPAAVDDRRLAPLRRHDAILAVSENTARECRRRFGSAAWRVSKIDVAVNRAFLGEESSEPLTRVSGEELGRLGIIGPYLFANLVGGSDRANLSGIIEAYHRLPFEHRRRHQLVIAGPMSDPWGVVAYLHDRGCAEGLVLAGEVDEVTLRTLYRRCSAFVSPSIDEGPGLTLVEALSSGAAIVAGRAGTQAEIVGGAGLLADPSDGAEIAGQLARVLSNSDLQQTLREEASARAAKFGWEPVIQEVLSRLQAEETVSPGSRLRFDQAHVARPRIAVFVAAPVSELRTFVLAEQVPAAWTEAYNIDLYLDAEHAPLVDGLPSELGGFDTRQFERNDGILRYHAVVYRMSSIEEIETRLSRLRTRPGLVLFCEPDELDRSRVEFSPENSSRTLALLRELLLTSSRVGIQSADLLERIKHDLSEFTDQIFELTEEFVEGRPAAPFSLLDELERCSADLPRGPGRLVRRPGSRPGGMGSTPHSLRSSFRDDEVTSRSG